MTSRRNRRRNPAQEAPGRKGGVPGLRQFVVHRREGGQRLDLFLVEAIPGLSRKGAKRLVDGHQVSVDGRIEPMASRVLRGGEQVETVLIQDREVAPPPEIRVLSEDDHFLAADKPPGIPSGPTRDRSRLHVAALAEGLAGRRLTLLHRLDKDTSGVLLFGKTREFSKALLEDFRHRRVEKRYLALVRGRTQQEFQVISHLREAEGDRIQTVRSGGMRAETGFRVLARAADYSLVEAVPRTGRTHQIRVHLAHAGCPILGDGLYGGDAAVGGGYVPRQMLHAWALSFQHGASGANVRVESPVPDDFLGVARGIFGENLPVALTKSGGVEARKRGGKS